MRSTHEKLVYNCSECGENFAHKHLLVRHKRKHKPKTDSNIEESRDETECIEGSKRLRPDSGSLTELPIKKQKIDILDDIWGSTNITQRIVINEHMEEKRDGDEEIDTGTATLNFAADIRVEIEAK